METTNVTEGQYYLLYITASKIMYISPTLAENNLAVSYPITATCAVFATLADAEQYVIANNLITPN